jgi:putative tryptophan/tyrosine transport system substrate-binding protein
VNGEALGVRMTIRKINFYIALSAVVVTLCGPIHAQQAGKIFRIGFLDSSTPSGIAVLVEALRQELRKLGWTEGRNVIIEFRFAEQKPDRLPQLAAELVRLNVDVIVAPAGPSVLAAKDATKTIPIVMTNPADPVGEGMVASLARPGSNVTGLSSLGVELNTKRLEILKETIPKLAQVGLLRPPGENISMRLQLKALRAAAPELKVRLEEIKAEADADGLESAFKAAKQKRVDAVMTVTTRPFFAERKRIVEFAGKYWLPAIYYQKEFVDDGGLMFYGADFSELFRRGAHYVDKILKGAKPADLPVQQATKFEFMINLKAAKQIGLIVPPNVLARADRVIR